MVEGGFFNNNIELMSCVHGPSNRFEKKDFGCQNSNVSTEYKVRTSKHNSSK